MGVKRKMKSGAEENNLTGAAYQSKPSAADDGGRVGIIECDGSPGAWARTPGPVASLEALPTPPPASAELPTQSSSTAKFGRTVPHRFSLQERDRVQGHRRTGAVVG